LSAFEKAVKPWKGEETRGVGFIRGNGADDESTGSDLESDGRQPEVVWLRKLDTALYSAVYI
jgi:hypothetical protein